jgi:hypothetical protein
LEELDEKFKRSSQQVAQLSNNLTELTEAVEELSERVTEKSSGDGAGADREYLGIREAMRRIKAEIVDMTMRSGVVYAELLRSRQNAMVQRRERSSAKRKNRMLHGMKGVALSASFGGDDGVDHDDD